MKKIYFLLGSILILGLGYGVYHFTKADTPKYTKPPKRTRIDEAIRWRKEVTQDPATGTVPHERMSAVYRRIAELEATAHLRNATLTNAKWRERGPYSVAGRTRAILIDKGDPTGNTIFTAGVTGGLWKTTNISSRIPQWRDIGHFYDNINISAIAQNLNNPDEMYFGTGEPHGGAGIGMGIWKSTDGGDNWTQLPSTAPTSTGNPFEVVVRLFVHPVTNDVYAATQSGLRRSQDGGVTWTKVLGAGLSFGSSDRITDLEYAADGAIYISLGHGGSSNLYRSDAGDNQGDIGNWIRLTSGSTGMPGGRTRIELTAAPSNANVIYALTAQGGDATGIYRSNNRGENWQKTSDAPPAFGMANFARGQAWYDLDICVSPVNENSLIIGGIDLLFSNNAGTSWTQISQWFGGGGFQEVHADQHLILWDKDRPNRVFFGNDGGIYLSTNSAQTIENRNNGYNVTQFYGLAIHPDLNSNYFLAGAQDNGTQQFDNFDIANTDEVLGGDGFMCHIDQNDPNIQFISLYYGNWRVTTNGGVNGRQSFGAMRSSDVGSGFYTPSDYDNDAQILYTQGSANGQYFRWPLTDLGTGDGDYVDISNFNGAVRHVYASDNVADRIWIGSTAGRILRIDNASTSNSVVGVSFNLPSNGTISSIVEELGNPNHMIVTQSNYGVQSVFESTNGGSSWTSIEGDLPDMPVNWAAFHPFDNDKLLLATDAGVWITEDINGGSTNWVVSLKMPVVRTDMLQTRQSDGVIAAGTYGRGIFTTDFLAPAVVRMELENISYVDVEPNVRDYSINSQSWLWDFGDGNTYTTEVPNHIYSTEGAYTVSLTINDTATTSDNITVLPDRPAPYTEDSDIYGGTFETNTDDFGVYTRSGTSWERGESAVFGKNGTSSGSNAWVTGLTNTFYENNTETYLYTPNFDLTEPAIYEFKFNAKFNIQEGFDGMRIEYTLDKGQTWAVLGTYNEDLPTDANRWYNYTSTSSLTAFQQGTSYFSGAQLDWKEYKTDLNSLVGNSDVAFRFAFKSNDSNRRAGVAIDDFQITKYDDILETLLRSFTAGFVTPNGNEISLDWTTQPEYRCSHFKISVSENGRDFTEYAVEIPGQGSTADASSYNYSPLNMIKDIYYFKIKVVDQDGAFFESDVRVVSRNDDDDPLDIAKLYPNPIGSYIDLAFTKFIDEKIVINIYDAAGKLVISEGLVPNDVYTRVETAVLQAGVYVLVVQSGDDRIVRKLVKH